MKSTNSSTSTQKCRQDLPQNTILHNIFYSEQGNLSSADEASHWIHPRFYRETCTLHEEMQKGWFAKFHQMESMLTLTKRYLGPHSLHHNAVIAIWPESPMIECDCWEWRCPCDWLANCGRVLRGSVAIPPLSRCDNRGPPRRWSRPIRVTMAGGHGEHWQMICGNYQHIVHSALPYYIIWR